MRKILITGANSYIGVSFNNWLAKETEKYSIETVDMRDNLWKKKDFSEFDVVFHVAGIAHIRETKENQELYYIVNRDLAYETAMKAKVEGVKQFVFLSSMSVYGIENGNIDRNTALNPQSNYGKSKLQAEELITPLNDNSFRVAVLRPPMIYGRGCKGNYPRLAKLAVSIPIFPDINNERSMLYIDNLSEFIRLLIDDCMSGFFFPQNIEYVKVCDMVRLVAEIHGKKIWMTKLFNPLLKLMNFNIVYKVFGDLTYDRSLSNISKQYNTISFKDSIIRTELGE